MPRHLLSVQHLVHLRHQVHPAAWANTFRIRQNPDAAPPPPRAALIHHGQVPPAANGPPHANQARSRPAGHAAGSFRSDRRHKGGRAGRTLDADPAVAQPVLELRDGQVAQGQVLCSMVMLEAQG